MIRLWKPISPVVSLLSILVSVVNGPFPPSDADLKSLVCIERIVTRAHCSLTWTHKSKLRHGQVQKSISTVRVILLLSIHVCVSHGNKSIAACAQHCAMPSHVISFSGEELDACSPTPPRTGNTRKDPP